MFRQAAELLLATLSACDEGFPVSYVVRVLLFVLACVASLSFLVLCCIIWDGRGVAHFCLLTHGGVVCHPFDLGNRCKTW